MVDETVSTTWTGIVAIRRFITKYVHLIGGGGRGRLTEGPTELLWGVGMCGEHIGRMLRGFLGGGGMVQHHADLF